MSKSNSSIIIKKTELEKFESKANRLLEHVKWTKKAPSAVRAVGNSRPCWRETTQEVTEPTQRSLIRTAHSVDPHSIILPPKVNDTLHSVRTALMLGMHLSTLYTKRSGLDQLITLNTRARLSGTQKEDFRQKQTAASFIALATSCHYLLWTIPSEHDNMRGTVSESEIWLHDPVRAMECFLFYMTENIVSGLRDNQGTIASSVSKFSKKYLTELLDREQELNLTNSFFETCFELEGEDYILNGISKNPAKSSAVVEFNKVSFDRIVGNTEAKHRAKRTVERLLCYDITANRNPLFELGALSTINMGYGLPGTGKSLLIAATASMLQEYCAWLDIPFKFNPLPDNIVSTFQGGSAERMVGWMQEIQDKSSIIYAPIDDGENNLQERSHDGISAGVREVVSVFLRYTEGAYAVNYGNSVIDIYTNLPEQIDKAVLSRIGSRFHIAGAKNEHDFLDQDYLWQEKFRQMDKSFIKMQDPEDYQYLSAQKPGVPSEITLHETLPEVVSNLINQTDRFASRDNQNYFAKLYSHAHKTFGFTSRDLRNIQRSIDGRIMDFDFPEEWLTEKKLFFAKDYDTKKQMLLELIRSKLGEGGFSKLRFEESVRYLSNLAVIGNREKDRKVQALLDEIEVRQIAQDRLQTR